MYERGEAARKFCAVRLGGGAGSALMMERQLLYEVVSIVLIVSWRCLFRELLIVLKAGNLRV